MKREGSKSNNNSPERPQQGVRKQSQQRSGNIIEFVDSQDPNVKSAIQRHTAYHSAAQRREAKIQSLRRGSQSRYLEWGRRPGPDALTDSRSSSENSLSNVSPSLQPLSAEPPSAAPVESKSPDAVTKSPSSDVLSPVDESIFSSCKPSSLGTLYATDVCRS